MYFNYCIRQREKGDKKNDGKKPKIIRESMVHTNTNQNWYSGISINEFSAICLNLKLNNDDEKFVTCKNTRNLEIFKKKKENK